MKANDIMIMVLFLFVTFQFALMTCAGVAVEDVAGDLDRRVGILEGGTQCVCAVNVK